MLARLQMKLSSNQIDYRKSSNLQGAMFEYADPSYSTFLHNQNMHPYSQYLRRDSSGIYWIINALTEDAYQYILLPILSDVEQLHIKGIKDPIDIEEKNISTLSEDALIDLFRNGAKEYELEFITPTAFKQKGHYIILPDLKLMYQNLMLKCEALSHDAGSFDEDVLSEIAESSFITSHRIQSIRFPMEKVFTPGFVGRIRIKCEGDSGAAGYTRFLLHFGEYAGVGIKTGMGMGAMRIVSEKGTGREGYDRTGDKN